MTKNTPLTPSEGGHFMSFLDMIPTKLDSFVQPASQPTPRPRPNMLRNDSGQIQLTDEDAKELLRVVRTIAMGYWFDNNDPARFDKSKRRRISRESIVNIARASLNKLGIGWQGFYPTRTK